MEGDPTDDLANLFFQLRFVSYQCRPQTLRATLQHLRHLAETQTESTQRSDLRRTDHRSGTEGPIARGGTGRNDESPFFVKPQCLG